MPKAFSNLRPRRRAWRYLRWSVTALVLLATIAAWVHSLGRILAYQGQIGAIRSGRVIEVRENITAVNGGVGISLYRRSWPDIPGSAGPWSFAVTINSSAHAGPQAYPNYFVFKCGPHFFHAPGRFGIHGLGFALFLMVETDQGNDRSFTTEITLPFWFVLAVSAIVPTLEVLAPVRRKLRGPTPTGAMAAFEVVPRNKSGDG